MKLETNMYVRFIADCNVYTFMKNRNDNFNKGQILRLGQWHLDFGPFSNEAIKDFIKSSHDLIDLIEINDYVNGKRVRDTYLDGIRHYIKLEGSNNRFYDDDIKEILTKELYEFNVYKVV